MASRVRSRRALREQGDQAEKAEQEEATEGEESQTDDTLDAEPKVKKPRTRKASGTKVPKVKAPAKARVRKRAVKAPARTFARWAVCDNGMKRVAVFEYKDRASADAKLAEMQEKKAGGYFLIMVKDAYVPPPDAEIPAPEAVAAI